MLLHLQGDQKVSEQPNSDIFIHNLTQHNPILYSFECRISLKRKFTKFKRIQNKILYKSIVAHQTRGPQNQTKRIHPMENDSGLSNKLMFAEINNLTCSIVLDLFTITA